MEDLITRIETLRGSKVILYATSDRPAPFGGQIGLDAIPLFKKHLEKIGKTQKIDLVIFSTGGDTLVPWRLVAMIREYCDEYSLIVLHKAHSAATMIALGADIILMDELSEISPIDPSVTNPYNPVDSQNPQIKLPISVEDVFAYLDLASKKIGIKREEELVKVFNKLVESNPSVHPLAIGNVFRSHNLIRLLANKLLSSHVKKMSDDEIAKVVSILTEKLHSHHYFIGRKEAKDDIGIKTVTTPSEEEAKWMRDAYEKLTTYMKLGTGFNPETELGVESRILIESSNAIIQSSSLKSEFLTKAEITRVQIPVVQNTPNGQIQVLQNQVNLKINSQQWK